MPSDCTAAGVTKGHLHASPSRAQSKGLRMDRGSGRWDGRHFAGLKAGGGLDGRPGRIRARSCERLAPAKDPATGEDGSARAAGRSMAGGRGFEPRHTDPESAVLPLDEPPVANGFYHIALLGTITA